MAHKSWKGSFFKDTFLLSQKIIEKEDAGRVEDDNEPSNSDESNETFLRKSTRKSLQYQSILTGRKCIICNEDRYSKGRLIPLINLSLAMPEGQYKAEANLNKFAKLHLKNNNTKYVDGAKLILLTLGSTSLFAANVSYHQKNCYYPFRSPWWEQKLKKINELNPGNYLADPIEQLFNLVTYHIIIKHEIYTLAQLTRFYEELSGGDGSQEH